MNLYDEQGKNARHTLNRLQAKWRTLGDPRETGKFLQAWSENAGDMADMISAGELSAIGIANQAFNLEMTRAKVPIDTSVSIVPASMMTPTRSNLKMLMGAALSDIYGTLTGRGRNFAMHRLTRNAHLGIQDAGRTAMHARMVDEPTVEEYVRSLRLPSCKRCGLLAGTFWKTSEAFDRHPECDCVNRPVFDAQRGAEELVDIEAAVRSGQITGLSAKDAQRIIDGEPPAKVIKRHQGLKNSGRDRRRGVQGARESMYQRRIEAGLDKWGRDVQGRYRVIGVDGRLEPYEVLKRAKGDRAKAQRDMIKQGYFEAAMAAPPEVSVTGRVYKDAKAARAARRKLGDDYEHFEFSDKSGWGVRAKEKVSAPAVAAPVAAPAPTPKVEVPRSGVRPLSKAKWVPGREWDMRSNLNFSTKAEAEKWIKEEWKPVGFTTGKPIVFQTPEGKWDVRDFFRGKPVLEKGQNIRDEVARVMPNYMPSVPKEIRREVDEALDLIASVHRGVSTPLKIQLNKESTSLGSMSAGLGRTSLRATSTMRISAENLGHYKATAVHEMGHFFDRQLLTIEGDRYATTAHKDTPGRPKNLDTLMKALKDSPDFQREVVAQFKLGKHPYYQYLATDVEIWARAYTQYIAHKTRDPDLLRELASPTWRRIHWDADWFEENMMKHFDEVFEEFAPVGEAPEVIPVAKKTRRTRS